MTYQTIDLTNWVREDQFNFYMGFDHPWFNICCQIDSSLLFSYCKKNKHSFYHAYLYLTQQALAENPAFHYRIVDNEVRIYQNISIGIALTGHDQMLRFCYLPYATEFNEFTVLATEKEQQIKALPFKITAVNGDFENKEAQQDVVHMSVLPWIDFSSFSNARSGNNNEAVPKIVYGKCSQHGNSMKIPISVEVHHGLMDGLHVSQFINSLQNLFNTPELLDET